MSSSPVAGIGDPVARHRGSGSLAARGLAGFAAAMMLVTGGFGATMGLGSLVDDQVYEDAPRYVFDFGPVAWGVLHLAFGILVAAAGVAVLSGRRWARVVGIVLAALGALIAFAYLPYEPVWALLLAAVNICTIWALCVQDRDVMAL
jgi:hypothetical protein